MSSPWFSPSLELLLATPAVVEHATAPSQVTASLQAAGREAHAEPSHPEPSHPVAKRATRPPAFAPSSAHVLEVQLLSRPLLGATDQSLEAAATAATLQSLNILSGSLVLLKPMQRDGCAQVAQLHAFTDPKAPPPASSMLNGIYCSPVLLHNLGVPLGGGRVSIHVPESTRVHLPSARKAVCTWASTNPPKNPLPCDLRMASLN